MIKMYFPYVRDPHKNLSLAIYYPDQNFAFSFLFYLYFFKINL